jgi:hypothetical protein
VTAKRGRPFFGGIFTVVPLQMAQLQLENLVIIRNSRFSDLLVGVEHESNLTSHVVGGEVLLELDADCTVVTVAGNDLAPLALVIGTGLSVL